MLNTEVKMLLNFALPNLLLPSPEDHIVATAFRKEVMFIVNFL